MTLSEGLEAGHSRGQYAGAAWCVAVLSVLSGLTSQSIAIFPQFEEWRRLGCYAVWLL
jgi:hypothetical protein